MKKSLALAGLALICAIPALADNTDTKTVTVNGAIVAPLTISAASALTMPNLVRPEGAEPSTTVSVGCKPADANVVTYTANGNPFAHGVASAGSPDAGTSNTGNKTGTCAVVTVTGETDYFFVYTVGNYVAPTTGGVTISDAVCTNDGVDITTNVKLLSGTATLRCGAKVTATSAAVSYTDGKFDVTVTYD